MKKGHIILIIVLAVLLGGVIFYNSYKLDEITISGCTVVDEKLVKEMLEKSGYANNSIKLYIGNRINPVSDIPFVDKMDVDFVTKNKVNVTVYEKSIAGCVEYMDAYIFFDKDGIILDSKAKRIKGIPCIKGLEFESWEKNGKLPISDQKKFQLILTITQLIEKYELDIDGIKFTTENEILLMHGNITIELGEGEYLAVQMMNLGSILEGLEGMEGTLHMKDFNSDDASASFSRKNKKKP